MKIDVDNERLKKIVHQFEEWKQDYAQLLQRYDVKLQHSREKQAMLNSEQVSLSSLIFSYSIHFPHDDGSSKRRSVDTSISIDLILGEKIAELQHPEFVSRDASGYIDIVCAVPVLRRYSLSREKNTEMQGTSLLSSV